MRDKAKLTNEQAEGFADAIAEALQGDFVTKANLRMTEASLRGVIASAKYEIFKWMFFVAIGFQTIIILSAVVALAQVVK